MSYTIQCASVLVTEVNSELTDGTAFSRGFVSSSSMSDSTNSAEQILFFFGLFLASLKFLLLSLAWPRAFPTRHQDFEEWWKLNQVLESVQVPPIQQCAE